MQHQQNSFFNEGGKLLYGQRFGYAVEYRISLRSKSGIPCVRIERGMILPEDPYMPYVSKSDLVCELLWMLLSKYKKIKVFLYKQGVILTDDLKLCEIKTIVKRRQRTFLKISVNTPSGVSSELEANLDLVLEKIDIFS